MKRTIAKILLVIVFLCFTLFPVFAQKQNEDDGSMWSWFWEIFSEEMMGNGNSDRASNPQEMMRGMQLRISLKGLSKFNIGDNLAWKNPTYNDSKWEKIAIPADWENEGFNGYDGYAWYRLHFHGKSLNPKDVHFLVLGFIDDVDEIYFNGKLIGKSGSFPPRNRTAYNSFRKYAVPIEVINFEGDNVIAVRVYDEMGNGGIVAGDIGLYVSKRVEDLLMLQNLNGIWKFNSYDKTNSKNQSFDDSEWEDILVPAYWDNHGYKTFDGIAWYRKHFQLTFKQVPGKRYYLVLGKIDDFDQTYLNGVKIGETNDYKGFGNSQSYLKTRIYKIPAGLLIEDAKNTIAIKVEDVGLDGGLYEGPFGIYEEDDLIHIKK